MNTIQRMGVAGLALGAVLGLAGCETLAGGRARLVTLPPRCEDQKVQIYFEPDSDTVTAEGRAVIGQAAAGARGCKVARVQVLGLADAAGAPQANLELSRRRAQSVTAALAEAGLPAAEFDVTAAGQAGATTAAGLTQPVRRRADVVVHLTAPK